MSEREIGKGDLALLKHPGGKEWLVNAGEGTYSTHLGQVELDALTGLEWGSRVRTHAGRPLYVLKPTIEEMVLDFERPTQVVYPKDFGYIVGKTSLRTGMRVAEAGTGSGVLTAMIAWTVSPNGRVKSFEVREDFAEVAEKNLKRVNLDSFVELHVGDVAQAGVSGQFDAFFLDLADPWNYLSEVERTLKPSGYLVCIIPTFNQLEKTGTSLGEGFTDTEAVEIMERRIQVSEGKTRPETRMIGHTAFILTARKVV